MAYNQVRANIRNAMVGMTLTEARDFRDDWATGEKKRRWPRCAEYAGEFVRELEDEEINCSYGV